jgi:hypothetical protein
VTSSCFVPPENPVLPARSVPSDFSPDFFISSFPSHLLSFC